MGKEIDLKLECENLVNYKNNMKHLYASHASSKGVKRLYITGYGSFIVELNNEKVLECIQAFSAVEKFYEL